MQKSEDGITVKGIEECLQVITSLVNARVISPFIKLESAEVQKARAEVKAFQHAGAGKCETKVWLLVCGTKHSAILATSGMPDPHSRGFSTVFLSCWEGC